MPPADKVQIDLKTLEIRPGTTRMEGTANSQSAVGDIVSALKKDKCFSKIDQGDITSVADGKKQFPLTITTECF